MNIFILDLDPVKCAKYHADKHVNKMILESAQMLFSTAHHVGLQDIPYKKTHFNHPCTKWVRESKQNFLYLLELVKALNQECKSRYNKPTDHLSYTKLMDFNIEKVGDLLPDIGLTEFAQAMPDYCKIPGDAVAAYRKYYINEKRDIAKWKTEIPYWYS